MIVLLYFNKISLFFLKKIMPCGRYAIEAYAHTPHFANKRQTFAAASTPLLKVFFTHKKKTHVNRTCEKATSFFFAFNGNNVIFNEEHTIAKTWIMCLQHFFQKVKIAELMRFG